MGGVGVAGGGVGVLGGGVVDAGVTVTVVDTLSEPPAPVQDRLNVAFAVSAAVCAEPLTAFVPDHPPEAVQDVVFDDVQVSVDFSLAFTF